jgi:hypothetical protein
MARVKLTAPRIEALECPPGTRQVIVWDSDTPGLGVRVTQGAKAFVFQSRYARNSSCLRRKRSTD